MLQYDITEKVRAARNFYDKLLDERIARISKLSGVSMNHFIKVNPAEFIEKNSFQTIKGYTYQKIEKWIEMNKKDSETFLISPADAVAETAAQVSYKSGRRIDRVVRASKCEVVPVPRRLALDFFIRNHRQSLPLVNRSAICLGLLYKGEIIVVMLYGISNGAVRGSKKEYELVRLSIAKGTQIHGGASKLQMACEAVLRAMGEKRIYSYSNATINSGAVYEKLGFTGRKVTEGQPFVITEGYKLVRLANLHPESTDGKLAAHGWIKTHISGNRLWYKNI